MRTIWKKVRKRSQNNCIFKLAIEKKGEKKSGSELAQDLSNASGSSTVSRTIPYHN